MAKKRAAPSPKQKAVQKKFAAAVKAGTLKKGKPLQA